MDVIAIFNRCGSIKSTAKISGLSETKVRKLLISAGAYETPLTKKIASLISQGYAPDQIAAACGLTKKNLSNYLPYTKGVYNADAPTDNAIRIRRCRKNKKED